MSLRMLEEIPEETNVADKEQDEEVGKSLIASASKPVGFENKATAPAPAPAPAADKPSAKLRRFHQNIAHLFFPSYQFTKVLLSSVIPALTILVPLFYTGQIANDAALAVVSQFAFVSVMLKVFQDTIINGMFYMIGRDYDERRKTALHTFKICTFVLFCLGMVFTTVVMTCTDIIIHAIKTPESITPATTNYLFISAISFPFILVSEAIKAHLLITQHILIVVASVIQAVIILILNVMLFGTQKISLHWGIEQLGIYKVIESTICFGINTAFFFLIEDLNANMFFKQVPFIQGMKQKVNTLIHVSWANFCESTVRNIFYFVVTLTFMNQLGPDAAAAWNVLNMIVFSFLLLPALTVANQVKISIGRQASKPNLKANVRTVTAQNFRTLSAWCLLVGIIGLGIWPFMAQLFSPNNINVQRLSYSMFLHIGWAFILFAYSNAANGIFYGLGETRYVLYACCVANGLVYFVPWLMYLGHMLEPTYWCVLGLYAAGVVVSAIITIMFAFILYKRIGQQQIVMSMDVI